MKKIIIILGLSILLVAGVVFFFGNTVDEIGSQDSQITNDVEQTSLYNPSESVFTPEQQAVQEQVKEKIQNSTVKTEYTPTPGAVLVDKYPQNVPSAKNPDYDTIFYPETNTFDIMLYTFPLEETRKRAGGYLAEKLGLSEEELCQLRIVVSVVPSISSSLAGKNLGLSACAGSADLSKYTENIDGMSNIQE